MEGIEIYKKIDWNKLLRKDLGEHNLEQAKPNLDRIKLLFDGIISYPDFEQLSNQFKQQVRNQLVAFTQFTDQIINNFQNTSERQVWIENIRNKEYEIYQNLSSVYNYIINFDPGKDAKLKIVIEQSEKRIQKLNEDLSKAETLLQHAQAKMVKSEIVDYGNFFGKEAKNNRDTAFRNRLYMFVGILLMAVISVCLLIDSNYQYSQDLSFWENGIQYIIKQNILIKFFLISLIGYLIAHFSKIYCTEKNLYNLNIQRQNALNSHKQILDSIIATQSENEKEVRNAILLELTKAMFANRETGYLKNAKDNPLIEITRSVNGK